MTENNDKKNGEVKGILRISNAPHLKSKSSVPQIMWMVVLALMPAAGYSVYVFGINALIVMVSSVFAAVAAEALFQFMMKKKITVHDGSAVITGLLVAMNVPPDSPAWMSVIGSFFAIIIVKQLFGGLGFNIFNPALAARAFLMASWPVYMTTKWHKFAGSNILSEGIKNRLNLPPQAFDAITQSTPLAVIKEGPKILAGYNLTLRDIQELILSPEMFKSLFFGNIGGCIGETSVVMLLIGGIFLLARRIITWHIPVSYIGTVAVMAYVYYLIAGYPPAHLMVLFHTLSGGLFLGAFYMATDYVSSPVSPRGMIIFGIGCGVITFVIRIWGGYPEGVSYSILLMNAVVPIIDRLTRPKVFGT